MAVKKATEAAETAEKTQAEVSTDEAKGPKTAAQRLPQGQIKPLHTRQKNLPSGRDRI